MEQHNTSKQNWDPTIWQAAMETPNEPMPPLQPPQPQSSFFPTAGRELIFGLVILVTGMLLRNSVLFGGFNLGFAIFSGLSILCAVAYLLISGCRFSLYSGSLLGLSLVICAGFARTDDGFVKFVMFCFLLVSTNLGLCLLAGQNRRSPNGVTSLLDASRAAFALSWGKLPDAFRGLVRAFRRSGSAGKKGSAVLLGLLVAVPILAILIPPLMQADAAFDALLDMLPEWDITEFFATAIVGAYVVCWLYCRAVALKHAPKAAPAQTAAGKGISVLTVNTVLTAVAFVYVVYLISQLAYFSGGLLGILPEGYTMAEYARRGFFEMAWLCAINLSIIALSVGLVKKDGAAPLSTRLICLFIGIVTLFLVVTASAKMFLYIGAYGLTRLRVLTEVIMVFLGITTLLLSVWLFVPKLAYMKAILLVGLVIGAAVFWADVDTVVARYNVTAYQAGKLETVDVSYLNYELGSGALPYIQMLENDSDPAVAAEVRDILEHRDAHEAEDYRGWNYVNHIAENILD